MIHYAYYEKCKLEELIREIQNTDDEFLWEIAAERTKKSIYKVFHKKVHQYYKDNMKEDIYTILRQGWVKSVKTFDPLRGKAGFIAYTSTLMHQAYVVFARRIKEEKIGKSVRDVLLSSVTCDSIQEMNERLIEGAAVNIVKCNESIEDFSNIEITNYLDDMLNRLRNEDNLLYEFITMHYLNNVTQKKLSEIYSMSQSSVSRVLKRGLSFLKNEMRDYY